MLGNKKKGLGGGNCQISSTLYNAVLTIPSLKVIERHEHSNKVPYAKKEKMLLLLMEVMILNFKIILAMI